MNLAQTVIRCRRRPSPWAARILMLAALSFAAAFVLHVVGHIHKASLKAEARREMQHLANLEEQR